MLRPNFCCQEFGESCLISSTYLNNLKMKIQYAENGFKYWWIIHPSCGHQHESMAWWLSIRCFSDNIDTYPNLFISFLYCVALSQSVDSRTPFQILCMYWEVTYHWQQIFFGVKRKFWWSSQGLVTYQSHDRCFAQFFLSSIIHWSLSKRRHRNKSSCSLLNRVQSSRSKLTTFLNTGSQLRIQSNRVSAQTPIEQGVCSDSNQTATSDGCVQKLGIISGN